jgi:ABC-type multidrug transport system fused ATPase/permease subunit
MKLLLKAALRSRRHLNLLLCTILALLGLTLANQLEMFSLGIISNTGADFFALFGHAQDGAVTLSDVETAWPKIDHQGTGAITKESATTYLASLKDSNPLQWVMAKIKTEWNISGNFQAMIYILIFVAIFKAVWLFLSRYMSQILAIRVSRDLRKQYFEHIQSLPMSFYQEHNIGSLSSRVVTDANQISLSLNALATNVLQTPFTVVTTLFFCFCLSWKLSLVIFIGVPLIILPIVTLAKRVKRVSRQLQSNQEKFASVLIDFLAGIQTVKIFSMELFSLKKYQEQNERMAVLETKTAKYGLLIRPILHLITTVCLATVVIVGLHTLHMSVSQLIVFCGLLHMLYEPIKKFAEENMQIQKGIVAAERMFDVLRLKSAIEDQPHAKELISFQDSIEFDHVWFRYQGEWILKDVSFKVRKGETVAIVGPTGAGKSTIVQLIPRLFDVQKGEIRVDGKPLNAYTQKSLREQIAFVSQKPFLFYDSVAANISYGQGYSLPQIERAAKRAYADEFIERLPKKYDEVLAEGGQSLSGGQQQRLAIARALFKNASLLILDEATSSLDALSELKIKQAISQLHGEVTQIIIAHRLTTIEHADRILYLENGEKVAEGTREELLKNCLPFRLLWEAHYQKAREIEPSFA